MTRARIPGVCRQLIELRQLVGFLGSRKACGWWDCDFADSTGLRMLATVLPRSHKRAALEATCEAAQRVHDEALGRMGCYHLFRLPPEIEDRLEGMDHGTEALDKDGAMAALGDLADSVIDAPEGPVQIGVQKRILSQTSVQELAAHYHSAFKRGIRCYPYFSADPQ